MSCLPLLNFWSLRQIVHYKANWRNSVRSVCYVGACNIQPMAAHAQHDDRPVSSLYSIFYHRSYAFPKHSLALFLRYHYRLVSAPYACNRFAAGCVVIVLLYFFLWEMFQNKNTCRKQHSQKKINRTIAPASSIHRSKEELFACLCRTFLVENNSS